MNSIERIRTICDRNHISIARLERECGFSNGYIRNLKEGTMPADRMLLVSEFLGVPMVELITGKKDDRELSRKEFILLDVYRNLNEDGQEELNRYAHMLLRLPEYQKGQKLLGSNLG